MKRTNKHFCACVAGLLVMSLTLGNGIQPNTQAAAKKAKLAKKTLTLTVGKKGTIKIKNKNKKAKYLYKVKKASIAKVSTKGKVTAKKEGKTTVTVKEKTKKKVRNLGKVKIIVKKASSVTTPTQSAQPTQTPVQTSQPDQSAQPTQTPTQTPAQTIKPSQTPEQSAEPSQAPEESVKPSQTPEESAEPSQTPEQSAEPSQTPEESAEPSQTPEQSEAPSAAPAFVETLDLSTVEEARGEYDEATATLTMKNVEFFRFPLSQGVSKGKWIEVTVTGSCKTDTVGFRSWLVDGGNTTLVENPAGLYQSNNDPTFTAGDFKITYRLTSTGDAKYLFFKGPSYGTKIDELVLKTIEVGYCEKTEKIEPKDPTVPDEEQDPDTTNLVLTQSYSQHGDTLCNNPLMTQSFMADPTAIEYDGRLYVFGTADKVEFDDQGNVINNAYNTHELQCISSADLVNWTDHGTIDVKKVAPWVSNSWAPSITSKTVDGKTKFYLYFANGGNGIGVLEGETPLGPWSDPCGKALIDRSVANCSTAEVPWLFDPGVFVDDDGTGYLYFGGSSDTATGPSNPKTGRVVKLGADMVSLDGDPQTIESPWMFEDNEINKIGDTYYYSYCTNWDSENPYGVATIGYMTSTDPLSGFEFQGILFENPGKVFGNTYNNHHKLVQFKGEWYIIYHSTILEEAMYGTKKGYRTLHIDKLDVTDGKLSATATWEGPAAVDTLNPYNTLTSTMAWNGGLKTVYSKTKGAMVLDSIHTGDWFGLSNVDFGDEGAKSVTASIASKTTTGSVEIWIDGLSEKDGGEKIGTLSLVDTGDEDTFQDVNADLSKTVTGKHDVYFVFRGSEYHFADVVFNK